MIINTNVQALITNNALWHKNNALTNASKKLSLGTKVNSASDDPALFAISNKMKSLINGIEIADKNTNDAVSLVQTAEGGIIEIQNMVQRMRELAVQGANGTLTDRDRMIIQQEIDQVVEEISATADRIEFNQKPLLNERYPDLIFQIGEKEGMEITLDLRSMRASGLNLSGINYSRASLAEAAIERIDNSLSIISSFRAELGAVQNRLEQNSNSLDVSSENAKGALSRIKDTDMAYEMSEYTKNNVLVQSSLAMLAQANQRPNQLLALLQ